MPILSDHVVFSPAPLLFSCGHSIESCWPEFCMESSELGAISVSGDIYTIISWMAAAKELIQNGRTVYLPALL